ncbi:hypothetical protein KKF84_13350, partial [Myxococcota bacterium]|nr:hypothetical protein [Myxococcota bacterium]
MKFLLPLFVMIALVGSCSFDTSGVDQNNSNNTNNTNNVSPCEGEAPLADLQAGVCLGALKVCDATDVAWVEPDYTLIAGYEAVEVTCDGTD